MLQWRTRLPLGGRCCTEKVTCSECWLSMRLLWFVTVTSVLWCVSMRCFTGCCLLWLFEAVPPHPPAQLVRILGPSWVARVFAKFWCFQHSEALFLIIFQWHSICWQSSLESLVFIQFYSVSAVSCPTPTGHFWWFGGNLYSADEAALNIFDQDTTAILQWDCRFDLCIQCIGEFSCLDQ
jgi:hypothetical protein